MVSDCFADTLLSWPEQYHRLKFTINLDKDKKNLKLQNLNPNDLFPEDNLMCQILENNGASDRIECLRSRIRISRAIAVFVPALTFSGLPALGKVQDKLRLYK